MYFLNRLIFGGNEDYVRRNISYEVSSEKDEYDNSSSSPRFLESEYQHFDLNFLFPFELENEDEEGDEINDYIRGSSMKEWNSSEEELKILSFSNEYLLYCFSTKINLINLVNNKLEFVFRYHELPIIDMKKLNSTIFCSISFDRTLCFWDITQKKMICSFRHDEESHNYFTHLKIIKNRNSQRNNLVLISSEFSEFFLLINLVDVTDPNEIDDESEYTNKYKVNVIKKIRRYNNNEDRLKKFLVLKSNHDYLPSISNTNPNNLIVENIVEVTDFNIYNFDLKKNSFVVIRKFKKKIKIIKNVNFVVPHTKKLSKKDDPVSTSSSIEKYFIVHCFNSSFVFVLSIQSLKVLKKLNCNLFYGSSSYHNDDYNKCLKIKIKSNNLFIFTTCGISVFNHNFECLIHNKFNLNIPYPLTNDESPYEKQIMIKNNSKNFLFLKNNIICYFKNKESSKSGASSSKNNQKNRYNKIKFLKLNPKTNKLKEIKTIKLKNRIQMMKKIYVDDALSSSESKREESSGDDHQHIQGGQEKKQSSTIRFLTFCENENFMIIWNNVWRGKKRKNKLAISFMCL